MIQTAHSRFIFKHVEIFLSEAVSAFHSLDDGIDIYPTCEYLCQSSFLRMTGAQEQKLRCICWDLSTYDYNLRYEYMNLAGKLGQYSSYDNKKDVFNLLRGKKSDLFSQDWKNQTVEEVKAELHEIVETSIFRSWNPRMYSEYKKCTSLFKPEEYCSNEQLLLGNMHKVYEYLFKGRNRLAHNLLSYQENLPSLKFLSDKDSNYHNYFMWFATLMLLDRIFIHLYEVNMERIAASE